MSTVIGLSGLSIGANKNSAVVLVMGGADVCFSHKVCRAAAFRDCLSCGGLRCQQPQHDSAGDHHGTCKMYRQGEQGDIPGRSH